MQSLEFTGIVRINKGAFSQEITLPGKGELLVAPDDWPIRLFPGTVSVCVSANGFRVQLALLQAFSAISSEKEAFLGH